MNLGEMASRLSFELKNMEVDTKKEVTGCYISDLLSDVMANSRDGDLWITLQTHPNIVAVAVLKNLSAIVISNNRQPEKETLKRAEAEKMPILTCAKTTFEIAGMIYNSLNVKAV